MKKIMLFTVALIIMIAPIGFGQYADMNSDWRYGNLVFYNASNRESIIDAMGPDIFKSLDHFITLNYDTINQSHATTNPGNWVVTAVDVGTGTSEIQLLDSVGGMIKLAAAQNDNDGIQMQIESESFILDTSTSATRVNIVYCGARVKIIPAIQRDFLVGLCAKTTTLITATGGGVYFRAADGAATVQFVTETGTTETSTTVITTQDTIGFYNLEWYYDKTIGHVSAYVNRVLVATHTTGIPITELTKSLAYLNGVATGSTNGMIVDKFNVIEIRLP